MLSFDRLEHPPKDLPAIYPPSSAPSDLVLCGEPRECWLPAPAGHAPFVAWDFPCKERDRPDGAILILRIGQLVAHQVREIVMNDESRSVLIEKALPLKGLRKVEATDLLAPIPKNRIRFTIPAIPTT